VKHPLIRLVNLHKKYATRHGTVKAVDGVSFEIEAGETYSLLGPSGCGKTTTLRCIAGIETPDSGEIWIGDQCVFDGQSIVPTYKRAIGMVFQSYAVWPHMTVFENVAYPLRRSGLKLGDKEIRERVTEVIRLVKLQGMEDRPAPFLSGGQQQRVALARAIVRPGVKALLFDEPLSNLDARLRDETRLELKQLLAGVDLAAIYVTHDQAEALALSQRIAVMSAGRIVEEGTPRDLYLRPAHNFTASFLSNTNLLQGHVAHASVPGVLEVDVSGHRLACATPQGTAMTPGTPITVSIRPEDISLTRERPLDSSNVFDAEVELAVFLGQAVETTVRSGLGVMRTTSRFSNIELVEKDHAFMHLPPEKCILIRDTSQSWQ